MFRFTQSNTLMTMHSTTLRILFLINFNLCSFIAELEQNSNPTAFKLARTSLSFGRSECSRSQELECVSSTLHPCASCSGRPSVSRTKQCFLYCLVLSLIVLCIVQIVFTWKSVKLRRKFRFSSSLMTRKCR